MRKVKFHKRNKVVQDLYDMPVGESMEFVGQDTKTPKGAYGALHNHLHNDKQPYYYQARTIIVKDVPKLIITKTGENKAVLNINSYPEDILKVLRVKMDLAVDDDSLDEVLRQIPRDDVLDYVLKEKEFDVPSDFIKSIIEGVYSVKLK